MKQRHWNRWALVCCGLALVALLAGPSLLAAPPSQGDKPSASEKPVAEKSTAKKRIAKKPVTPGARNPRMPDHFNKVVNAQQRAKVVEILKQYQAQIQQKRAELKAVTDERDAAVMAVLTPEQKRQVVELRAASEARRKASLAASRAEEAGEAPAVPKDTKPQ